MFSMFCERKLGYSAKPWQLQMIEKYHILPKHSDDYYWYNWMKESWIWHRVRKKGSKIEKWIRFGGGNSAWLIWRWWLNNESKKASMINTVWICLAWCLRWSQSTGCQHLLRHLPFLSTTNLVLSHRSLDENVRKKVGFISVGRILLSEIRF